MSQHDNINRHDDKEWMTLYLDARLDHKENAAIEKHFVDCADCRKEFSVLKRLKLGMKQVPLTPMPRNLAVALQDQIHQKSQAEAFPNVLKLSQLTLSRWFTLPRIWIPTAALGFMALAIFFWLKPTTVNEDQISVENLWAAHHRYAEELAVPLSDLSSGSFSARLASYDGAVE